MSWEIIVSIYAAIVATLALIWNIIDSRKKRHLNFVLNVVIKLFVLKNKVCTILIH